MRPIVKFSSPRLRKGRWHATASVMVGPDEVLIHASAPQRLVSRARSGAMAYAGRYVQFVGPQRNAFGYGELLDGSDGSLDGVRRNWPMADGGDAIGCVGCGFAGEDFGNIFDDITSVVKKVADSPFVRAIPFVGTGAALISGAVSLYDGVKKGSRKAKKKLKKIRRDAAKGVPQAKEALDKVEQVRRADQLRTAGKRGSRLALGKLRQVGEGLRRRDPAAYDVAQMMERLEAIEKRSAKRTEPFDEDSDGPVPVREQSRTEPYDQDSDGPIEIEYPTDDMDSMEAVDAIMGELGAAARARAPKMSQRDRALLAQLKQILQKRPKLNLRGLRPQGASR